MTGIASQNAAAAAPPARPDRGEDGVGGDDEQADVDVVHADPRLDEEHPVERARSSPTRPATSRRRNRIRASRYSSAAVSAPAMTPGSRQAKACDPTSIDADVAVRAEHAGAAGGPRTGTRARRPWPTRPARSRRAARASAKTALVAVGLDDVDRPRPGRRVASGARPRMWTIWRRLVVDDASVPGPGSGSWPWSSPARPSALSPPTAMTVVARVARRRRWSRTASGRRGR